MNVHSACTFQACFLLHPGRGYSLNSRSKKTVRVCKPPWICKKKKKEYLFSSLWKHRWLAISSCYSPGKLLLVICYHFYRGWFMRSSFLHFFKVGIGKLFCFVKKKRTLLYLRWCFVSWRQYNCEMSFLFILLNITGFQRGMQPKSSTRELVKRDRERQGNSFRFQCMQWKLELDPL